MSGAAAGVGKDVLSGIQYAVNEINAGGGVLGQQIQFKYQDNGTNAQTAVSQARVLAQSGIKLLLAPQSSGSALAVSTLVSKMEKIPTCISSSNADAMTIQQYEPYVFEVGPNSYMEMQAVAKKLGAEPYKRYAIISADYAGGRANAVRFKQFIKQFNPQAQIVDEEYPAFGANDYTATINKVLAAKPDYVFTVLFGADLITFSKQAKAVGFFGKINNNFIGLYDANTFTALGADAAAGTDGWQRAPYNLLLKNGGTAAAYINGFKGANGSVPSDWTTLGYDCVKTWARATTVAKSFEPSGVMKAIETATFDSPRGSFTFDSFDHQALVPVYIGKVVADSGNGHPGLDVTDQIPGKDTAPDQATVDQMRKDYQPGK